jgi:hypothetical protein
LYYNPVLYANEYCVYLLVTQSVFRHTAEMRLTTNLGILLLASTISFGATIGADWTSTGGGTLNGTAFTISGLTGLFQGGVQILNRTYTSNEFSAGPQASAEAVTYAANNAWSVTFAAPIFDLLLYVDLWRGSISTGSDPTSNYTFSLPFSVASGLDAAGVSGDTISLPDGQFHQGILKFSGPVTTLSIRTDSTTGSGQVLTFAVTGESQVPEPGSFGLIVAAAVVGSGRALLRRRKLSRK